MRPVPESPVPAPRPIVQIAVGVVVSVLAIAVPWACGVGTRQQLPSVVQCQLDALKVLPHDVGMLTVYDAIDIYERVHACRRAHGDAGP